ncbi:hypothetical protein [Pseudoclavibacter sp. RFBB5]|uniref:hypothetical protein n=1 Tax=Pseudoclavibacter sp. RFBB5 TaxID=2080574 RepID=UPI0021577508|nr:hypothetical protein [Pseudoclavibacter sp. RFBB5]
MFDESATAHPELLFLQGDTRRAGSPENDSVARSQITRMLVESVTAAAANRKTLELIAERGPRQPDLDPVFAALQADAEGALDAALDPDTLPLDREPAAFPAEIAEVARRGQSASAN